MHVRPGPGLLVADPARRDYLPPEGREVPETGYWVRRLQDGDVVRSTPPADPAAEVKMEMPSPRIRHKER